MILHSYEITEKINSFILKIFKKHQADFDNVCQGK